jgi:hypothetical protein
MTSVKKQQGLDAAAKRAARLLEREQISDQRVADEERRHSNMLAKTTRLREQRLARDAAASGGAKNEEKPKGRETSRRSARKEK